MFNYTVHTMNSPFPVVRKGDPLGGSDFDRESYIAQLVGENAQLRSQVGELEQALREDPLTGLYNQLGFDERLDDLLKESAQRKRPLSVAFFDINNFKQCNDRYGHVGGDAVIKAVAAAVQREVDQYGLVGRLHGDEFAVALPDVTEDFAEGYCDSLRERISRLSIDCQGQHVSVTVTFGVKQWKPGESLSQLMSAANRCFYLGQDLGKNCVVSERLYKELCP